MLASTTTGPLPDLLSEPAILPRAELSARVVAHAQTRSWGAVADLLTEAELSSLPQHCVFLTRALQGLALINAHQYPLASAALDRRGAPAPIEPALAPLLTALADIASRLAAGDLSTADAAAAHAAAALAHWPAPSDALADALGTAAERAALQRGLDDLPTLARIARVAALVAGAASVPERTVRTQLAWPAKVALEPFIAALGGSVNASAVIFSRDAAAALASRCAPLSAQRAGAALASAGTIALLARVTATLAVPVTGAASTALSLSAERIDNVKADTTALLGHLQ